MIGIDPLGTSLGILPPIFLIEIINHQLQVTKAAAHGAEDLSCSLWTLGDVFQGVHNKFTFEPSLGAVDPQSKKSLTLKKYIDEHERICIPIYNNVTKIVGSVKGAKTLKIWWRRGDLKDFQQKLESQESPLTLH